MIFHGFPSVLYLLGSRYDDYDVLHKISTVIFDSLIELLLIMCVSCIYCCIKCTYVKKGHMSTIDTRWLNPNLPYPSNQQLVTPTRGLSHNPYVGRWGPRSCPARFTSHPGLTPRCRDDWERDVDGPVHGW